MAIVLDGFGSVQTRVPFIKPPDLTRMQTGIPRSILTFVVVNGTVNLKPINDQQNVQVAVALPTEFAYRLIDAQMNIVQSTAASYQELGELRITNAYRGQPLGTTSRHRMTGGTGFTFSPITQQRFWNLVRNPTGILQSIAQGVAAGIDFRMVNNEDPAAGAGTINFLATFYEYDIDQVQMFLPLTGSNVFDLSSA